MSTPGTILVASTDVELLSMVRQIGGVIGCAVAAVDSIACALDFFHGGKIRVTLLDDALADGPGVELLRRMRHVDPDAKVVFVTASPAEGTERAVRGAGVHYYGTKPVDASLLRRVLEKALEHETRRLVQASA